MVCCAAQIRKDFSPSPRLGSGVLSLEITAVLVQSPDRNLDFAAKLQASPAKRPFRADHVGSLLRPPPLAAARHRAEHGEITHKELRRVEDAAIRDVVAYQQKLGFGLATDGE